MPECLFLHSYLLEGKKKGQQKFNSLKRLCEFSEKEICRIPNLKFMNYEKDQTYDEFSSKYGYSIKALSSIAEIQRLRERQNNLKNSYNYVSRKNI